MKVKDETEQLDANLSPQDKVSREGMMSLIRTVEEIQIWHENQDDQIIKFKEMEAIPGPETTIDWFRKA